jgi:DNA mismatch repair ATPase MutS
VSPTASDFQNVLKFSKSLLRLKVLFQRFEGFIFEKMNRLIEDKIVEEIIDDIESLIDMKDSAKQNRVVIHEGVDASLDRLKSIYRTLPSLLV